jgi:ElaB/YqjD/DUF883 family membrane-anchored ribosome-binding protein
MNTRFETPAALRHDSHVLADDARALLAATAEVTDEKVAQARQRLESALERARQAAEGVKERAAEGARQADGMIRSHPYESLAVALGIGALLGFVLSRRN